ncbi:hypothetical protein PAGU1678_30030 [Paraclostridium bifermentans subsp. muricolitidis]|nr:hypothetical protein PAGU1678_30030 [Paraclostridium bifermentans subsp. muricolitidis]
MLRNRINKNISLYKKVFGIYLEYVEKTFHNYTKFRIDNINYTYY